VNAWSEAAYWSSSKLDLLVGFRSQSDNIRSSDLSDYAELAVSSPVVAETITSTHCSYPRRDVQAEWDWGSPGWYIGQRWSPIRLLTVLDVAELCGCDQCRYHCSKAAISMKSLC